MEFWELVYTVAKRIEYPTTKIGIALGHSASYIACMRATAKDTTTSKAAAILETMGYGLFACPLDDIPSNGFRIDGNTK